MKLGSNYQNNPFMIGLDGVKLFFSKSRTTAIYSMIVTGVIIILTFAVFVSAFVTAFQMTQSESDALQRADQQAWQSFLYPTSPVDVIVPIAREVGLQFVMLVISLLIFGVLDYAAARNAKGKDVVLKEAFKEVLTRFPSYLWTYLILSLKLLGWTLLFIVPGIIMFYRYILTGTVFFAEDKTGHAASKRSAELTKGRWLTTFAGTSIWPIITQGIGSYIFMPGSLAILYRQFSGSDKRVKAHWASWTILAVILTFAVFVALLLILVAVLASTSFGP